MGMPFASPFTLMRWLFEDLDRFSEGFGPGLMPRIETSSRGREEAMWAPAVDVLEREGQLVIRADVPGLTKDQISVEVEDRQVVISGERRHEHEERREGFHHSERSYGSFYRARIEIQEGDGAKHAQQPKSA
jgi:HSP20 family protein